MQQEGNSLAEDGKYSTAIQRWDQALALTPDTAALYELKAQVGILYIKISFGVVAAADTVMGLQAFLALNNTWPAVQSATKAVELDQEWPDGHLTLARAQLNYGEVLVYPIFNNLLVQDRCISILVTRFSIKVLMEPSAESFHCKSRKSDLASCRL